MTCRKSRTVCLPRVNSLPSLQTNSGQERKKPLVAQRLLKSVANLHGGFPPPPILTGLHRLSPSSLCPTVLLFVRLLTIARSHRLIRGGLFLLFWRRRLLLTRSIRQDHRGKLFLVEWNRDNLSGIPFTDYYPYLALFDSQCFGEKINQLLVGFALGWFGQQLDLQSISIEADLPLLCAGGYFYLNVQNTCPSNTRSPIRTACTRRIRMRGEISTIPILVGIIREIR